MQRTMLALTIGILFAAGNPSFGNPSDTREAGVWLQGKSLELVRSSRTTMQDGTAAFVPQAGAGYDAFWLRDYAYMLEGCPEAFTRQELRDACLTFVRALRDDGAGVDCVKLDGTPIYMPGYGTMGENPVADGSQFTVDVAWRTHQQLRDSALLKEIIDPLVEAMHAVPRDRQTDLVFIDPLKPWDRCPYGFTDGIRMTGSVLFCSLLDVRASRQLADLLNDTGRTDEAATWQAAAEAKVNAVRETFWDPNVGLFRAATAKCRQPDIWGSVFAVHQGVADAKQSLAVASYLKDHYAELVQEGQIRHLPGNMAWEATQNGVGGYQNGGFWGVATGWFVAALRLADPPLADRTMTDLIHSYQRRGVQEWIHNEQAGVSNYTASATLPLATFRSLYNLPAPPTLKEVGGAFLPDNLAADSGGGRPFAKDVISGHAAHATACLNDGIYGNQHSWVAGSRQSFVGVAFDKPRTFDSMAFGRDNTGTYKDRFTGVYTLQYTRVNSPDAQTPDTDWISFGVVYLDPHYPDTTGYLRHRYEFTPIEGVTGVRIVVDGDGIGIDELEIYRLGEAAARLQAKHLFRKQGTDTVDDFSTVSKVHSFDVINPTSSYLMLTFERAPEVVFLPNVVRLDPNGRQAVVMTVREDTTSLSFRYAVSTAAVAFRSHTDRYRAYCDGETVMCIPVAPPLHASMLGRTKRILDDSKALVTDDKMPPETFVYTPGPFYRSAGLFARDFLYQLEGGGRDTVAADEIKRAVDLLASKQLTSNKTVGASTYPKGAIPDHVYPDGQYAWGPGEHFGDVPGHFNRPSLDEAMCFVTLAWHYGYKAAWDRAWQDWFAQNAGRFVDAWESAPRNPQTGLITQWTTPGHAGANGIQETNGACVMWGFHDSYALPGDDLGTSVLACNAARALADMYDHVSDSNAARIWTAKANAMQNAIRAQFQPGGWLPWGIGDGAPTMASPDITGYAVWSGILTDDQADAASDWLARCYAADKQAGGPADLFHMTPGYRGAVRMARKAEDRYPGSHIWPHTDGAHWENLCYGYNAYQDGGYWYYMSLGIAQTLWHNHPDVAKEWVANIYADIAAVNEDHPYERIDGMNPQNGRYNASIGSLMGMATPAHVSAMSASVSQLPN